MADALLGFATESLLTNLISLANEQISGVWGVEEDLRSLAKQLGQIQALLLDAQTRSTTNKTIELWLQELEDVAVDADDLLDEFAYEVKMQKEMKDKVCSFLSSVNPLGFRFKMASKIKKINLEMKEIFKHANNLGLRAAEIINSLTDPRDVLLTDPFVDVSKIVGRDDDVSKLVSLLTGSKNEKCLSVIGIVGMGGQGKTTLAQLLVKDDKLKKHFEKRVWTYVSDDFNVNRVLRDMLQTLTRKPSKLTNRQAIVEELSKELQGKRFLLVLDDVWNEESQLWDRLNNSLQAIGGSKGSKIIVTTRNEVVITMMNGSIYRLGVLSQKASQELFEKIAFENGRATKTPPLLKIGERIVARCGGVPLALKAIGGLLSSRRDELEWRKIEESSIWSTLDGVRSAIKLSFDYLPSLSLKQCFTYCCVFPKNSIIKTNLMIQQWMAHGWLNPSSGSGLEMEDVGNNYLKILLQRSLLQEAKFDIYGNIASCNMHDLVHDFALTISKGRCLTAKIGELSDDIKAVHLSILPDESNDLNISEKKFSRLRTLHLSHGFSDENFLAQCKCEHLRALTLADWETKKFPISIAKMKHLRSLDISQTCITALPKFISKLYNLQTLRLPFVQNLPNDFVRLVNLRHLYITEDDDLHGNFKPHLVPGIGQLTSLRTLNCFGVTRDKECQIEELGKLNHLEGSLRIMGLENVANGDDARRANLSEKRNMESLELFWNHNNVEGSRNDESVLEGLQPNDCLKSLFFIRFMGRSLPSWIQWLRNLMSMKLEYLEYCEQIPPLGHLPYLEVLCIRNLRSVKYVGKYFYGWPSQNVVSLNSSQTSMVVFPSLKELRFYDMSSFEEWLLPSFSSSSIELFPNLRKFEILNCPRLTSLPGRLLCSSTGLVSLRIESCPELVFMPNLSTFCSLKELSIFDCQVLVGFFMQKKKKELLSLPLGIDRCWSLQKLTISFPAASVMDPTKPFSNMTYKDNILRNFHPLFSFLESLTLIGMRGSNSLPEQIQHFTALKYLTLERFFHLLTLPEWLGNFHSLETLRLDRCYSLTTFPSVEVMQGLTNLKSLRITECPHLEHTCQRETGAEWHKIAHIPDIQKYL